MMFIDNKEEGQVGAQGQRLNEPNTGVPIKKRPFQLSNPSSLESSAPSLDMFSLTPKHTPKSPLDFPTHFDPGNPYSSNSYKPAGVAMNPLQDSNAIDMGRNYCLVQPTASPNFGMEAAEFNQCSTDLSLTGPSTISPKVYPGSSRSHSNNMEERSGLDLNLPTTDTWDSAMDGFTLESNGIAQAEPVEALAKQGTVNRMIPHGIITGLVPNGTGCSLKSPNMGKPSEKCNLSEVTLDLQLKLPPRPELRMKNFEHDCSSDLSLSLSGKDLNRSSKPVNAKAELVGSSQKNKEKDITNRNPKSVANSQKSKEKDIPNPNVKSAAQNQVFVKQELREVALQEKVTQARGLRDQSSASGSVVKNEPVDTSHNPLQPLGKLIAKSPCSGSEPVLTKQPEVSNNSSLAKGIDLNSATPLPEVSTGGKTINPAVAATVSQSDACPNSENTDTRKLSLNTSCLVPTSSPLAGTEDVKPLITSSPAPASVVHNNGKRMVPMASDGFSQGSADMDCSEEGHNLQISVTTGKTIENANCETNASSSSSIAKTPKQEPGIIGESENGGIEKSLVSSTTPTFKENQIQIPISAEAKSGQNNENDEPSGSTKLINQNMETDGSKSEASGSKSRSTSTSSMSRSDKEVDLPSSDRENGTSSRQIEGNHFYRRQFQRTGYGPDRAQFQRKNSRVPHWVDRSNTYPKRGQRWDGQRFSKFDGDRIEDEDNYGRRAGINMANRKRQNNRFNSRFGHKKSRGGFRFTRTNNNSDMNFDEGNDGRRRLSDDGSRPHPSRFQNRRRVSDVSPRGSDEMDAPAFERPNNHYNKRVDHTIIRRDRSFSPGQRRGPYQWTQPGEMISGHTDLLTRVDTRVRSPGRRPFFKKDNMNRRHISPSYNNRVRKLGRDNMHWNNGRQRSDMVGPHGPVSDVQDLEAYDELRCSGSEMMTFHARYPDNDGAYSDGGDPHSRVRNCGPGINRLREVGDQDEYRYNNRGGPHGWRDGNPNNNGDKIKRRRY